jgi:hypothetical protein
VRADPRLPVTASVAAMLPGQTVDLDVSISEEVAAGATGAEAALFYVCSTFAHGPLMCVVEREQLAAEGAVAPGPRRASLTLPRWAPASSAAKWYVGAVVLKPRKQDVRSFTPLHVGALPDPDAPAANVEPKFTGEEPGSYKGYFQMWLDLESLDVPAGGSIAGVLHIIPWVAENAPMKLLSATVELKTGIGPSPGTVEYPHRAGHHRFFGERDLPSGVQVDLPFRLEVPADAEPTSDVGSPTPIGTITRSGLRIDEGIYLPSRIVESKRPPGGTESKLWWLEATVVRRSFSGQNGAVEQQVRVHDAAVPAGWYADPGGAGWRWWDGAAWTGHVSPGAG